MEFAPYVHFSGNCAEALAFYVKVLHRKISFAHTYGDSPMASMVPADYAGKIMHATFDFEGGRLYACDAPPDRHGKIQGITLSIGAKDAAEAKKIFHALSQGGNVTMPFQQTFWSAGFGMFDDKFGVAWMVNTEQAA
uniref:VOC family protein n=1 Tax=Acidobacterium capsulatum TaxID=33075 RepID=A0A7V4XR34_9BACT